MFRNRKQVEVTHDGFVSYAWSPDVHGRVTRMVDLALDKHGIKIWQDNVDGPGPVRLGEGIRHSKFFLPVITDEYVAKTSQNMDADGVVANECQLEAKMGIAHQGMLATIPIVMASGLEDTSRWGRTLGGPFSHLMFVTCITDDDVEKAVDRLVRLMKNARRYETTDYPHFLDLTELDEMEAVPKRLAKEYVEGTRSWVYDKMQKNWLKKPRWREVFPIFGYAGVGKTVFMANVCQRGHLFEPEIVLDSLSDKESQEGMETTDVPDMVVLASHFFNRDDPKFSTAKACILSLTAQMCATLPLFRAICFRFNRNTDIAEVKSIAVKELFTRLIAEPFKYIEQDRHFCPPNGIRPFIVLDALDECTEERDGLSDILQTYWRELVPKWFGVCVSARPEDYLPPKMSSYDPTLLDTKDDNGMRIYLEHKLSPYFVDDELKVSMEIISERSQGYFLYAHCMLSELLQLDNLTLNDVRNADVFPRGLSAYYSQYFKRLFDKIGEEKYQTLVPPMCAARDPITLEVVGKLLGLSAKKAKMFLKKMAQLVIFEDETIQFVHGPSMVEFLTNPDLCLDQSLQVDKEKGRRALGQYCLENFHESSFAASHLVYLFRDDDQVVISEILCDFQKLHDILVALEVDPELFVGDLVRYYRGEDKDARVVVQALDKSLGFLKQDRKELASQLSGRIHDRNHPLVTSIPASLFYSRSVEPSLPDANDPFLMNLQGHALSVLSIVMNRDIIASGSLDGTIKIWSRGTGECLQTLQGHSGAVNSVAICGGVIVSGSADKTVKVWDLENGESTKTLEGHSSSVLSVAVSHDMIVSASEDASIKVWSLATGECLKTLTSQSNSVAISADMIVSASSDSTIKVWNLLNNDDEHFPKTLEGHSQSVDSVATSGNIIISGSKDETVKVWNSKTGQCLKTLQGHSSGITSVAICNETIVSGSSDNTIKVWNLQSGVCLQTLDNSVHTVALFDTTIACGSPDVTTINVWKLSLGNYSIPMDIDVEVDMVALEQKEKSS